jgi:hypothetical protein
VSSLGQALRRAFKRAARCHLLGLATPNFLIGSARVSQIATGADELVGEVLDRDGVRELAVPLAVFGEFAKLGLERRELS